MTDLVDLANVPFEYEIGGTKLTLVQLSIGRLFAMFEKRVRDQHIVDAKDICEALPPSEKAEFMTGALKSIPTGKELAERVEQEMESVSGIASVLAASTEMAGKPKTNDQIMALVSPDNMNELGALVSKICGVVVPEKKTADPN